MRQRISRAAAAAGRDRGDVTLLAVSKTHSAGLIRQALAAGQKAFGENYVQEALEKMDALAANDVEWHLVGPLQSNKTRMAAERFDWVHTVENGKIARRLSDQRPAGRAPLNVLIQVNVSGEASKSGVAPQGVLALAQAVGALPNLRLRGLMAIPEPTTDSNLQRYRFSEVRKAFQEIKAKGIAVDTLSMGMSDDLEAAIAEGATMVRIGTAIFGERRSGGTEAPPAPPLQKIRPAA